MREEITWKVNGFEQLSVNELYDILHLRTEAFVMEQNCPYQDMDYKDQKAIHIYGYIGSKLVAYSRAFKAGDYFQEASIGRVIINREYRMHGYGHDLMKKVLEWMEGEWGESKITISAQAHLEKFYNAHGFKREGENYIEDGIPHVKMKRK